MLHTVLFVLAFVCFFIAAIHGGSLGGGQPFWNRLVAAGFTAAALAAIPF